MSETNNNEVYFVDGCAIERDYVYIASTLEKFDSEEYVHSRMSIYDDQSRDKWFFHDVNSNIVSVCVKKRTSSESRKLCALSKEGEVEVYSNKDGSSILEKIPEAGLRLGTRGYVTQIREIGHTLYVCGANDQVYRRRDGTWESLTTDPLTIRSPLDPEYSILSSIDGVDENDVYVCGLSGCIFHYNGAQWKNIPVEIDENLNCVRCISSDEIWICGNNGAVLKGNARDGFKDVSGVHDNQTFWSLAKFQGKVYLAALDNLYVFDGRKISPVSSGLMPELQTYHLDAVEDALWSFGAKDLAFFDGSTWTRIDHPDNPPIR